MPYKKAPITDFARKLRPQDLYDLSTAMRGPDTNTSAGDSLKRQITTRLRAILFGPRVREAQSGPLWDEAPMSKEQFDIVINSMLALRDERSGDRWVHFVTHLKHALDVTKEHKIWGGHGQDLFYAMRDAITNRK